MDHLEFRLKAYMLIIFNFYHQYCFLNYLIDMQYKFAFIMFFFYQR